MRTARGRAQSAVRQSLPPPCRPPPRTPITGDAVLAGFCRTSGAQNLSGWSEFPPGHWALGLQKLGVMRFHSRAWLCRTNASDADLFLDVGAAISRPSLLPFREKVPRKGADEGDFWARIIYGGRPKGLPYPIPEGFLENRRGGACPSRRSKIRRAGLGPAPTKGRGGFCVCRKGGVLDPPARF